MGTINYGRSDFVNLGMNLPRYDNMDDEDQEIEYECLTDEIRGIIESEYLGEIKVEIQPGYYDGFWLKIEDPDFLYFDDCQEKQEYMKRLTALRRVLLKCVQYGLVVYSPGWCMGYETEENSYAEVDAAIRKAKEKARKTPTYRIYKGGLTYEY